ncbi:MAG TPA: hypothetical protein VFY40_11625, partial [Blastocatellia bacterium]|nr:hypothetical protein [Blastocatellia bacterium]
MNLKLSSAISVFVCLLAAAFAQSNPGSHVAYSQAADAWQAPQVVYTTPPKMFGARLKYGESEAREVRIKVTYTLTAANYDDTMVGTLVFTIPEDARKKIAETVCEPLSSIPASVTRKDVVAGFRKETSCPTVGI